MKKVLFIIAICICAFLFVACDESTTTNNSTSESSSSKSSSSKSSSSKSASSKSGDKKALESGEKGASSKTEDYTIIKFSDMYETKGNTKNVSTMLKNLNGKKVQIKGYPAVQSPLDESFVYLNNQPYVTCPFCTIGDVTKLEVIPIYMANKSKIKYTENALNVYGKLEVAAKLDSEGYTTQFRIYADKVEEVKDTAANKEVNSYYSLLSEKGMIYDIQTLQMNIEYASNPEYMVYYDEKLQTGKSTELDKVAVTKAIAAEYVGFDEQYYGSYLGYIKECPEIVMSCEPENEKLKELNADLLKLYTDEISILEKYQNICYKITEAGDELTLNQAESFLKELSDLNGPNLKQYEAFTAWNNRLRD